MFHQHGTQMNAGTNMAVIGIPVVR
jgi:hypothetical protein